MAAGLMAQLTLNRLRRDLLWKPIRGWLPPTLPADNLADPAEHLLSIGLAEVIDGRLLATQAGLRNADALTGRSMSGQPARSGTSA
jgi:hypothetical protein